MERSTRVAELQRRYLPIKSLTLIRGLPGCGKTTLAERLITGYISRLVPHGKLLIDAHSQIVAADDYFMCETGEYYCPGSQLHQPELKLCACSLNPGMGCEQRMEYRFNPKDLPKAHAWCLERATQILTTGPFKGRDTIVHNTFTQRWEMEPYIRLAEEAGARLVVVNLFDGGLSDEELAERTVHGVPVGAIARMRARFEHDWK